jgi:hypothetical protein
MSDWLAIAKERLANDGDVAVAETRETATRGTAKTDETTPRRATPAQLAELRELIAEILATDTEADRAEALEVASRDPVSALTSFRELVHDLRENRRWLPDRGVRR